MSSYTTLHFYRPTAPPVITGPRLAQFLRELDACGLFERKGVESLSAKFGRCIDEDDRGTIAEVPVDGLPGVMEVRTIEWDIDQDRVTLAESACILANHDRPIYRAHVFLGVARPDITAALQTLRPDDGEPNLALWDAALHLGPIELGCVEHESTFRTGWMSVSISGPGSLWPWTPRVLTDRAAIVPALGSLVRACRAAFPVHPGLLDEQPAVLRKLAIATRRRMGDLWPFDELDRPWDWCWGVAESE